MFAKPKAKPSLELVEFGIALLIGDVFEMFGQRLDMWSQLARRLETFAAETTVIKRHLERHGSSAHDYSLQCAIFCQLVADDGLNEWMNVDVLRPGWRNLGKGGEHPHRAIGSQQIVPNGKKAASDGSRRQHAAHLKRICSFRLR